MAHHRADRYRRPEGSPETTREILRRTEIRMPVSSNPRPTSRSIRKKSDPDHRRYPIRNNYQPSDGRLSANLIASGIDAGTITKVVFTHAHPDHVWGTLTEGGGLEISKCNLLHRRRRVEFLDGSGLTAATCRSNCMIRRRRTRDLGAIKDRVVMLKPGDDIVTGSGLSILPDIHRVIFRWRWQVAKG